MNRSNSITGRGLYRSRNGIILGVCRGLADYFDFSAFWIRAIAVILFIFTGFWPVVGIYFLAALLMKSAPTTYAGDGSNQRTGSRYRRTRNDTAGRLKRKWKHLEKRIRGMEDKVTSREYDWNRRFHG
ncbi:MAG: envelope stress response membrane protein PspC [Desulfobacterales bacterium]